MIESQLSLFGSSHWASVLFALVAMASTFIIIIVILSENRNPVKSLAWVTVLLLLPVAGVILYLFFGRSIKNTRMISRRNRRRLRRNERRLKVKSTEIQLEESSRQLVNMGRSLSGAHFYPSNSVEVFTDGQSKFESLKADLRAARHSINIQYYIFQDDELGSEVADILIDRARAGVKVRLIYDHVGSFNVKSRFFKRLREEGVEAHPFFKVSFPLLGTRVNWRNHRKIVVIDREVAYIGGMNVAQRYIDGGPFNVWRDTHLRVIGPIVGSLQFSFAVDWSFMGEELIDDLPAPANGVGCFKPSPKAVNGTGAQLLTSGPTSQWSNIATVLHKAIANARRRVYIQTPYFLPNEALLKALQAAALAHVDVRVLIPARSDSAMLTLASSSYIAECLRAGIKIYLYRKGMLHAKMIIVDDELVSIGSTNFDFRSFDYNFEANLFCYSTELNRRMIEVFREDLDDSDRIIIEEWKRRPLMRKFKESLLRLLSPVL